jgi:hypothetical protein
VAVPDGQQALTDTVLVAQDPASAGFFIEAAWSQGNEGPFPSFLDPLGGPDAQRQVWGCS